MKKRILTPFPPGSGKLANRLEYVEDKPDVDGKPKGRYKGFNKDEYVYAPKKAGDNYVGGTRLLAELQGPEDQLYINAHCERGEETLSNGAGDKLTMDDLIKQLKAHDLPETTRAKIKLWVCEGALDYGDKKSFAHGFSLAMDSAGYKSCRIFGYTLSLLARYDSTGTDPVKHKRVVKSDYERLKPIVKANPIFNRYFQKTLTKHGGDEEKAFAEAIPALFPSPSSIKAVLDERQTLAGDKRASTARVEFKNGNIVPNG